MNITIEIFNSMSILKNYSKEVLPHVDLVTSYPVQGAEYSKAYRKGVWDGRKRLFNKRTGAFPTGLVSSIQSTLSSLGYQVDVLDHRTPPTASNKGFNLKGVNLYDYQEDTCQKMVAQKQGVVKVGTGGGKTVISAAVIQYLGLKCLFVVTTKELLYQTSKRFKDLLNASNTEVGMIGDGIWEVGDLVTVATLDTLESRVNKPECQRLIKSTQVMFWDECHHMGSETWFDIATLCPAYYRYGLSGTPIDRTDGANLRLIAAVGDIIVDIPNKVLLEKGVIANAGIVFDKVTEPILEKKLAYPTAYKEGVVENAQMLRKIVNWTEVFHALGLGTLILCEEIQHGKLLDDALWVNAKSFIPHQFIYGEEDSDIRQKALADFASRSLPVLISSRILDEGVDVPTIDALILAGSRKSKIKTMQRLGRGLRGKKLIVVEFANLTHRYLTEHSLKRMEDYKQEDCFKIHNSEANIEFVRSLWDSL